MSLSQPESTSIPDTDILSAAKAAENLEFAKHEAIKLFSLTQESVVDICKFVEGARDKTSAKTAFRRLNLVFRLFLEAAPGPVHNLVRTAIRFFPISKRLDSFLTSADSVQAALTEYKTSVVLDLAANIQA